MNDLERSSIDEAVFATATRKVCNCAACMESYRKVVEAYLSHAQPKPPERTTRERLNEHVDESFPGIVASDRDLFLMGLLDVLTHPSPGVVEAMDDERKNGNCTTESMWQAGVAAMRRGQ